MAYVLSPGEFSQACRVSSERISQQRDNREKVRGQNSIPKRERICGTRAQRHLLQYITELIFIILSHLEAF